MTTLRDQLKAELRRIPKSVVEGGAMTAGLWKAKAERAQKILSQPRASMLEIERVLHELQTFK